ncbi:cyclopropane-fatty-acyl-phospholipid synthase family protein [Oceaniserpentilla sp. 4NH20-0058]|uniref:cyclopropane-fatty-acyl-phospholipid synthase family protein n=1 Tax=Oceaniserpentilla sp. 4NH20-0058 TaxID=3127660 RepID=UPI0031042066
MDSVASIEIKKNRISVFNQFAKRMVLSHLKRLHSGCIVIHDGKNIHSFGEKLNSSNELYGELTIHDTQAYSDIMTAGSIGAAEAYMTGDWSTPDLTKLMRVMVRNMDILNGLEGGIAKISKPFLKGFHWLNQNTEKGSRRNIAAHYDLGNDFFESFLDPTMMYSSGIFPSGNSTMEEASTYKLKTICEKLNLNENDHVVEIGTGWGSFAIYAAKNYGCKVTTTTISEQQYIYAANEVKLNGLESKITLLKQDYRNLEGKFDKLVSIEMIEAVGWKFYDTFFSKCASLLKSNGVMLIQAITIEDQRFDKAKKDVDFIQRYIFPGSCIPSIAAITHATKQSTDLRLVQLQDYAQHYARTLSQWHVAFNNNENQISQLGYSDDFKRMWRFYLSYCEAGFSERAIGVSHLVFAKPHFRQERLLNV